MEALGMAVRLDAAGNLRGIYPGRSQNAPTLLTGSHIDTVPNAGSFDGVLGLAIPLAILRSLNGRKLSFAVEVIAFSEEEGIRFRWPFIGSRAVAQTLTPPDLARTDDLGITIREALCHFDLDPAELPHAALTPGTFAFIECHIEQGPVLEALNLPLGIVTALVGQIRLAVTFTGTANHAGTTPMHLRQDALACAAAWITLVERHARSVPGLVATVGMISVTPNAANVIPGEAVLSLDIRHASDELRAHAVAELLRAAQSESISRGLEVHWRETSREDAVSMDRKLCDAFSEVMLTRGLFPHRMVSGAGHDAMILAAKVPSGMLFLRTPGGLSHHPAETVSEADVQAACDTLAAFLDRLAESPSA